MEIDNRFFDTIRDRTGTNSVKYACPPAGAPDDVLRLWVADMDFPPPPAVHAALEEASRREIFGYTEIDATYWELLAAWYERRMGWRVEQEWFSYAPNALSGVAAALCAVTEPGDGVVLCEPVYHPFAHIIKGLGRAARVSALRFEGGRYTFDYDDLEEKLREEHCRALLLCSPHNPVGRVWERAELEELARICIRYGTYVISDEIHADLVYAPHRHIPFASVSEEAAARTVAALAPTKTFNLAGLPAAQLVIPDAALRRRVRAACHAAGQGSPNLMAVAAARAAYREGEPWLEALLAYLRGNLSLLREAFPAGAPVSVLEAEGTYLAWLDCRALGLESAALDELFLKRAGLWLNSGAMFGRGGTGFMRLNFACPRGILRQAVTRLHTALDGI